MPIIRKKLAVLSKFKPVQRQTLQACRYCKRNFSSDRVVVHENICSNIKIKRPVFDSAKKRLSGSSPDKCSIGGKKQLQWRRGGENYVQQKYAPTKNNWRQTHEELIQNIRNARAVGRILKMGGNISDLPPPTPSLNPDYIQCPHCSRRFNEAAANRHIPLCADYQHNKPNLNLQSKNSKPKVNYPKFPRK